MRILIVAVCIIAIAAIIAGCRRRGGSQDATQTTGGENASAREIIVGGLYGSRNDDGTFRVKKVLVVDDFAVHLRLYKNKFPEMPMDLDPSTLSLGSIDDPDGFGIGHFPMAKEGFWNDNPVLLKQEPVRDDDLERYRMYLEAMEQ